MVQKKNKKQRTRLQVADSYSDKRETEIKNELKFGKPVEELENDQLFTITKQPNKDLKVLSKKELKKQEARNRKTFTERMLAGNDNIAPISKINTAIKKLDNDRTLLKKKVKHVNKTQEDDDDDFLDDHLKKQKKTDKKRKHEDGNDIWDDNNGEDSEEPHFLNDEIKEQVFKAPTHKPLVKNVKSLELPKPGMSYNPDRKEHQSVLVDAMKVELTAQKYVDKVNMKLEIDGSYIKENDAEIKKKNKEEEEAQEEAEKNKGDEDIFTLNIAQANALKERVTKKEKNARLRNKENIRKHLANQEKKRQSEHIEKSTNMVEELEKHDQEVSKRQENRKKVLEKRDTVSKKIGKYSVSLETEPVLLSNELPKSLKSLSNNNFSLLEDRYKSLQKRNIVEGAGPKAEQIIPQKKVYTRHSYNNTTPL